MTVPPSRRIGVGIGPDPFPTGERAGILETSGFAARTSRNLAVSP